MGYMQNCIQRILNKYVKNQVKKSLLPTLVVTIIFFTNYYFFGISNTLIGPFVTLSFLRFKNTNDLYSSMIKTFLIYIVISMLAFLAPLNLLLCIIVNGITLFWIGYILIDEYNPNNYFPAGMALIYFQLFPTGDLKALGIRWVALLASFLIIFILLIILFKLRKEDPLKTFVKEGLKKSREIIYLIEAGQLSLISKKQYELNEINQKISTEIYLANRDSMRKTVHANQYCTYVEYFQIVSFTANEFLAQETQDAEGDEYSDSDRLEIIKNMLRNFESAIELDIRLTDTDRIKFRDLKVDIRSFRLRFALRMVISVTPCLVIAYLRPEYNTYWLVISVFFMMVPVYEDTFRRVFDRTIGTMAGIVVCLVLFTLFKGLPERLVIMTIANFLIYASNNYGIMVIYITCSALALTGLLGSTMIIFVHRLVFTLGGAVITFVANQFIFPIRSAQSISFIKELLDDIKIRIKDFHRLKGKEKKFQVNKIIIKSYLLSSRLDDFNEALGDKGDKKDIYEFQKRHMLYITNWLLKGRQLNS